jgi:hypothetical protein
VNVFFKGIILIKSMGEGNALPVGVVKFRLFGTGCIAREKLPAGVEVVFSPGCWYTLCNYLMETSNLLFIVIGYTNDACKGFNPCWAEKLLVCV